MSFPYGKAPLAILLLTLTAGGVLLALNLSATVQDKPDLVFVTFAKDHAEVYKQVLPAFEKEHGVKVQLQIVDSRALQNRLESAMESGAPVPDVFEMLDGTMGVFTRGPLEDIGLIDLNERVKSQGLDKTLVASRFAKWSSRGHIFALPHDVHPVMLCYRRDLVEQLGIDVNKLTTWDEFARVGRSITKDYNGDGVIDHYMIDLPADGADAIRLLLLQRGGTLLDKSGDAAFDSDEAVDVVLWYVRATQGKDRFSFPCNWGQALAKAIHDGLCLFYLCPDWRTQQFEHDVPRMSGKLALMPLPAWKPGGLRTSTWGGTGMAFPKTCRNFDLAWKLAMYLYYDPKQLGPRFRTMNILPPLKQAWTMPEFAEPRPFYSNQPIGTMMAELAPDVPEEMVTPYLINARDKFGEAYINCALYYIEHGDAGLREFATRELKRCADQVRERIGRNVFLKRSATTQPEASAR